MLSVPVSARPPSSGARTTGRTTRRPRRGGLARPARAALALAVAVLTVAGAAPDAGAGAGRETPTITVVAAPDRYVPAGQPVTVTATVAGKGDAVPSGTVTFRNVGDVQCVEVPLVDGVATCTAVYRYPNKGATIKITARYNGDGLFTHATGRAASWIFVMRPLDLPGVRQIVTGVSRPGGSTVSSPPLSGGEATVYAFVVASGPDKKKQRITSVTGGGRSWVRVAASPGRHGVAEVWSATEPFWSGGKITASLALPAAASITVMTAVDGAVPPPGVGKAGRGARAALAITPVGAFDLVLAAGYAPADESAPVVPGSQSVLSATSLPGDAGVSWLQLAAVAPAPGTPVTVAATTTGKDWQLAGVDIPARK